MQCPQCGAEMRPGVARVHGTVLGFLFFGFSWQHLWFYPDAGDETRVKVIESGGEGRAWRCGQCGAVVIG